MNFFKSNSSNFFFKRFLIASGTFRGACAIGVASSFTVILYSFSKHPRPLNKSEKFLNTKSLSRLVSFSHKCLRLNVVFVNVRLLISST